MAPLTTCHWRLILTTVFYGFAGYCPYFYVTVFSPIELWVKDLAEKSIMSHYGVNLTEQALEWVWAGTSSSYQIGVLIGCATIKYPAEKLGRRNTVMVLKNLILIASCVLQFISQKVNSIELLILGLTLAGVVYAHTTLTPVFLAESSPIEFRGLVSSAPSLGGRLWSLSGSLLPLLTIFDSENTWSYLFLFPILPALLHLLATPLIPKSVKHLYITKKSRRLSRTAATFYHGPTVNVKKLNLNMNREADISPTMKIANIKVIFAGKQFRQPLILCVVAALMMAVGGENLVFQYSTGVLRSFGISPSKAKLYNALLIQLPVFVVSLAGVLSLEKMGRRPILLAGIALAAVGTGTLSLATPSESLSPSLPPIVSVVGLVLTVIGLTGGAKLICPVLPGELAPQASRSLTLGISRFSGSLVLFMLGFLFPPMNKAFGSCCILPLPLLGLLGFAYIFKMMPESKARPVYEIVQPWMPRRKSAEVKPKLNIISTATNETELSLYGNEWPSQAASPSVER